MSSYNVAVMLTHSEANYLVEGAKKPPTIHKRQIPGVPLSKDNDDGNDDCAATRQLVTDTATRNGHIFQQGALNSPHQKSQTDACASSPMTMERERRQKQKRKMTRLTTTMTNIKTWDKHASPNVTCRHPIAWNLFKISLSSPSSPSLHHHHHHHPTSTRTSSIASNLLGYTTSKGAGWI